MKGRSHRLPPSDPSDDWGDGSWTVDCSCGVTFDDGEEMVSCDECGVWVHTRCSRFSKGDSSFACHKCTARSSSSAHGDPEEAEVARLLAELPTKAADASFPPPPPPRRPFRLWAKIPLEDRVHVHGVPGGDPALFHGASPVFSSALWKCTGYVPKKFNFQYKEFPCWDEKGEGADEGENPANRGADVLYSLSKEIVPQIPTVRNFGWRPSIEGVRKREGSKALQGGRSQSGGKKERNNRLRVLGVHLGKQKDWSKGKERSSKSKARSSLQKAMHSDNKQGSVPVVDMNKSDLFEDGSLQVDEPDKTTEDRKQGITLGRNSSEHQEEKDNDSKKPRNIVIVKAQRGSSAEGLKQKNLSQANVKVEQVDQLEPVNPANTTEADASLAGHVEGSGPVNVFVKEEDISNIMLGLKPSKIEEHCDNDGNITSSGGIMDSERSKHTNELASAGCPDVSFVPILPCLDPGTAFVLTVDRTKMKTEVADESDRQNYQLPSCPVADMQLHNVHQLLQKPQNSSYSFENPQQHETSPCLQTEEQKSREDIVINDDACERNADTISGSGGSKQHELLVDDSVGALAAQKGSDEGKHDLKFADESSQSGGPTLKDVDCCDGKLAAGSGKVSSQVSRSVLGSLKSFGTAASSTAAKGVHFSRQQRVKMNASTIAKKDGAVVEVLSEESIGESLRKPVDSSSKPSHVENLASEVTGSSLAQSASSVQVRLKSSGSSQKNEKHNQAIPQQPSKAFNNPMTMHTSPSLNATTALSDEELALLLHQELNSSPRVPRVPRVRQGAGVQLASPTGTSMLSKRSSFSGVKDLVSNSRRKSKEDVPRDGSRHQRESSGETKRMGRHLPSPEQKHQERDTLMTDGSSKKDVRSRSPDIAISGRKNNSIVCTAGSSSCHPSLSEANGQNVLSTRSSPRDVSDDDGGVTSRTLPGLVDEIMKKGRCTSYEELCDAVRPHWHGLRKPNGERYAYSSHSQAVLDCLRNRNEWSHLIDRGPKTNSSKKKRKLDADTPSLESENDEAKSRGTKDEDDKNEESHREDFPKGKRKARKRRRLEPRSESVKDKKNHKQDLSDNDPAALSHSSNEEADGLLSDGDSQEVRPHSIGAADASGSSTDDTN